MFLGYGCCTANTRLLPKGRLKADVIATSDGQSCAYEKAQEKAEKWCQNKGRSMIVVNDSSSYQGMDKTAKGVIEGAGAMMGKGVYLGSGQDYKVRLKIKCR